MTHAINTVFQTNLKHIMFAFGCISSTKIEQAQTGCFIFLAQFTLAILFIYRCWQTVITSY
jgi:hypothetical protein